MKVVIKRPKECLCVTEVKDLQEINAIVGNVNEKGVGYDYTSSDSRCRIFKGIDIHMNENAVFNINLQENFWDTRGNRLYCGNVVFTGFDLDSGMPYGVCSLTEEQIEYLKSHISKVFDISCHIS